jgi:hypothetical protein
MRITQSEQVRTVSGYGHGTGLLEHAMHSTLTAEMFASHVSLNTAELRQSLVGIGDVAETQKNSLLAPIPRPALVAIPGKPARRGCHETNHQTPVLNE